MIRNYLYITVILLALITGSNSALSQVFIDPGAGLIVHHSSGFTAPRLNIGFHNILANRVGLYTTIEYAKPKNQPTYFRDIFGSILRINEVVSVVGGVGVFSNGVINNEFRLDRVRKEIGFDINLAKVNLNIDVIYSNSAGIGVNLGYTIPLRKKSKKYKPLQYFEEGADESNLYASSITIPADQLDNSDSINNSEVEVVELKTDEPEQPGAAEAEVKEEIYFGPAPQGVDGEKLPSGIYAVDGAFLNYKNAIKHAEVLRNHGFLGAHVGFYEAVNTYYIYLKYATNDQVIKDFIANVRETEMLKSCWLLRVH